MSTFSGVGGLELGLNPKQFEVIGLSEIYPSACDVLRYHHDTKNYHDITKIDAKELPDFDMLVGGSPCQSLSTAGTRKGFKGSSKLFFNFVDLLKAKNPDFFLWENVSGTFTSTFGYDFLAVLKSFHELGYNLQWQLVNSADLGAAQARNRVFVLGSKKSEALPGLINITDIPKFKNGGLRFSTFCGSLLGDNSIIPTITRSYGALSGNGAKVIDKKAPTEEVLKQIVESGVNKNIRLLTPLECERLMTWPDDHTKYGKKESGEVYELSDKERYKACGNGIVSICVSEVLEKFNKNQKHKFQDLSKLSELTLGKTKEEALSFLKKNKLKKDVDFIETRHTVLVKSPKMIKFLLQENEEIKDYFPKISNPKKGMLLSDGSLVECFTKQIASKKGQVLFKDVKDKSSKKTYLKSGECTYLLSKLK